VFLNKKGLNFFRWPKKSIYLFDKLPFLIYLKYSSKKSRPFWLIKIRESYPDFINVIIGSITEGMPNSKQGRIHPLLLQTLEQDNIDNFFLIL